MKFLEMLLSLTPAGSVVSLFKSKYTILIGALLVVVLGVYSYFIYQKHIIEVLKDDVVIAQAAKDKAVDAAKSSDATVKEMASAASAANAAEVSNKIKNDATDTNTVTVKQTKDKTISTIETKKISTDQMVHDISETQINAIWSEYCLFNSTKCGVVKK